MKLEIELSDGLMQEYFKDYEASLEEFTPDEKKWTFIEYVTDCLADYITMLDEQNVRPSK